MQNLSTKPPQKLFASPEELAEYHSIVQEIQQMVVTTHMPMAELIGLFFTSRLIAIALSAIMRLLPINPIVFLGVRMCSSIYSNGASFSVKEFYSQIDKLYQSHTAIDQWPSFLTGNTKKMMELLIGMKKLCGLSSGDHLIQSHKQEIRKAFSVLSGDILLKYCNVFSTLYEGFQNQSKAEIHINNVRMTLEEHLQKKLVSLSDFNKYIELIDSKRKETLTDLATSATKVFSRFNSLDQSGVCFGLPLTLIQILTGFFITKMLLKMTLRNHPLGIFPHFYNSCSNKAQLITEDLVSIRTDDYQSRMQELEAIRKNITPWNTLVLMVMRGFLLVSWLIMPRAFVSNDIYGKAVGVLMGFLQPFILSYALQGLFPFLKEQYQHYQRSQFLQKQLTHLNALSHALSLPQWKVEIKPRINTGYFLLVLSSDSYQEVGVNIVSKAILECFVKNKMEITFHSGRQFVLPESILMLDKKKIEKIASDVKIAINLLLDQKRLYSELKKLADQLKLTFYRVDTQDSQISEPNYCFVIKNNSENESSINNFLELLRQQYGHNRVKSETLNNGSIITIAYGKASGNSDFLKLFKNLRFEHSSASVVSSPSLVFSEKLEKSSEETRPATLKRRNITSDKPNETSNSGSPQSKCVIHFGRYGDYDSSKPSSQIKEIDAPFWPRHSHFMFFAATKEMFATDQQYSKFQTTEPRIVPKKGHKGIVSSGGVKFSNRGRIFSSKLKLKDPGEDLRVYDHVEKFKTTDGKEVHLHVFDRVISRSHKRV